MAPAPLRLLMLTHRFPYPPNRGDRIRSYNLLRVLSRHFHVTLGCTTDEAIPIDDQDHVDELCKDLFVAPLRRLTRHVNALKSFAFGRSLTEGMFASSVLKRNVHRWQLENPFDCVLVFCSSMFPYVDNDTYRNTPIFVDLVDVDSQKWDQMSRQSGVPKNWMYRMEAKRVQKLEQRIADTSETVILVSDHEAELFRSVVNSNVSVVGISNGVDTEFFDPEAATGSVNHSKEDSDQPVTNLVFVGVLDYSPNVEGMDWFCRNVMPRLREHHEVRLSIVGRRPTQRIRDLAAIAGVDVVGEVDDVRSYLKAADIAISPLSLARGIQNKVLEAMAMAMPVVVSPEAAEGIDAVDGIDLLVADQEIEDWVAAIERLAIDPGLRERMGESARKVVLGRYNWSQRLGPLCELLSQTRHDRPSKLQA